LLAFIEEFSQLSKTSNFEEDLEQRGVEEVYKDKLRSEIKAQINKKMDEEIEFLKKEFGWTGNGNQVNQVQASNQNGNQGPNQADQNVNQNENQNENQNGNQRPNQNGNQGPNQGQNQNENQPEGSSSKSISGGDSSQLKIVKI